MICLLSGECFVSLFDLDESKPAYLAANLMHAPTTDPTETMVITPALVVFDAFFSRWTSSNVCLFIYPSYQAKSQDASPEAGSADALGRGRPW